MAIQDEIRALYDSILKRPADDVGLNYFTNAVTSGAGTLADVARDMRASAEARGLLGGNTTTTTTAATNNTTSGLLGSAVNAAKGMDPAAADSFLSSLYNSMFYRAPDADGAAFWREALVSGRATPADVQAAFAKSPEGQGVQAGVRQVPFGSQAVGGNVYQVAQMPAAASMPSFQQFSSPGAMQNAFQQSLAYQAALPSMLPQFNPAEIPPTYQQIANPRQRLDIANIQLPQWLVDAAAKDEARTDKLVDAEVAAAGGTKTTAPATTGGVTSTAVGTQTTTADIPDWIVNTYANALGRAPEAAGAAYWNQQSQAGVPIADLIATIRSSPEALEYAASKGGGGLLGK